MVSPLNPEMIYELGERYSATSTINSKFVPIRASGYQIYGRIVDTEEEDWFADFSSAYGCANFGYNNGFVAQAIIEQLNTGICNFPSFDWHSERPVLLKKKLCEIVPVEGEKIAFLSNSGAEAIEAAMKACMARRLRETGHSDGRLNWLSFSGAFHGRTLGALSLNHSKEVHRRGFRTAAHSMAIPFPEQGKEESIGAFSHWLGNFGYALRTVNAIFIELVQGEGGIRVIDKTSLNRLMNICADYGIYVVVDEIQTGMMRTGKMFACHYYEIAPDIICLAKSLGGGLPLGATIMRKEFDFEPGQHASTFGGNPVACAASLVTIDQLEKMEQSPLLKENIKVFDEFHAEGLGMMRRFHFDESIARDETIRRCLYDHKIILLGAGKSELRLMPPLIIPPEELRKNLEKITDAAHSSLNLVS